MSVLEVAVALVQDGPRLFLQRRDPAAARMPGLWELPGGKLEPGESPEAALRRELAEELEWRPESVAALAPLTHAYPDFTVRLHPFRCAGADLPRTALAWGWFLPAEALRLALPGATRALLLATGG